MSRRNHSCLWEWYESARNTVTWVSSKIHSWVGQEKPLKKLKLQYGKRGCTSHRKGKRQERGSNGDTQRHASGWRTLNRLLLNRLLRHGLLHINESGKRMNMSQWKKYGRSFRMNQLEQLGNLKMLITLPVKSYPTPCCVELHFPALLALPRSSTYIRNVGESTFTDIWNPSSVITV